VWGRRRVRGVYVVTKIGLQQQLVAGFWLRCPLSLFPLRINNARLSVYAYHELLVMLQADHNCLPKIPAVGSFVGY